MLLAFRFVLSCTHKNRTCFQLGSNDYNIWWIFSLVFKSQKKNVNESTKKPLAVDYRKGNLGSLGLPRQVLTSSFFSFSDRTSFWFWVYSTSIRASWRRSSSSAARRPLYSASNRHASSTVFERRSAASLSMYK